MRNQKNSVGPDLIKYLGQLVLSGGDHDGELFRILPWEKKFIRGSFATRGTAALSVARGNGKSALVAGIACAVVDPAGPLHGPRREAVAVASSFSQSRIIFEDVLAFLRARYDLSDRTIWRTQDSENRAMVEFRPTGARVRTIGSDPSKAHGLRPALVLADEPAQWDSAKRDRMLAAIRTGLGKVPHSKMICLGTRPSDEGHWFSKMLEDGGTATYSQCHGVDPDDSPFKIATWRAANPSMDHLPSLLAEIRDEAKLAKKDPSMLASFKALRLNMGVSDTEQATLLDAATWAEIEGEAEVNGKCFWGVDLGTTAAMSAVAAYWPATGRLECLSAFPSEPTLGERGLRDGVGMLYSEGNKLGELIQTGGAAVDVSELVRAAATRFGPPTAIAADRWREGELRDSLKHARVPLARLELRGMGFKDGAEDVRGFRRACLEGAVTPIKSLILASAMSVARVTMDPAGNSKLSKKAEGGRRVNARDDAAAAAILAVALATRVPTGTSGGYLGST